MAMMKSRSFTNISVDPETKRLIVKIRGWLESRAGERITLSKAIEIIVKHFIDCQMHGEEAQAES